MYIGLPDTSPLAIDLKRYIRAVGSTEVVDTKNGADAVFEVLSDPEKNRTKTILSLNSNGRVSEYQLGYSINFRVLDKAGNQLLGPTSISLNRPITFNDSQVLAKETEEAQLYRDMRNDMVQQIMRRLAAIKPVLPAMSVAPVAPVTNGDVMQLRIDALDGHVAKPLAQLYVITSDEHLLALEAADKIRRAARAQGYSERDVLTVERSFKWGELLAANQELSLFGDKKLIELRIPTGKPGKDGGAALQSYAKNLSPDNLTLITLPKLDWATQKAAWVASLQQAAVYIEIPNVERAQLPAWISQRLAAQGQSAERASIDFIAERVEGNLLAAHQEIQKLGLLHEAGKLTYEQVQDAVLNVARYDVFKLSEAMLAGDPARLVRMLEGLKGEGEALPLVLWAVSEEIRTLLKLKAGMAQGRPLGALLKEYRIWGPRERMMEPALRRISLPVLEAALQQAAQVDKMIKGLRAKGYAGDAWDAMLQLGLKIARG
eukprot:gene16262-19340_t